MISTHVILYLTPQVVKPYLCLYASPTFATLFSLPLFSP
jgi:hypothetical protein